MHQRSKTFSVLRQLSWLTNPHNERISPFHLAPWTVSLMHQFPGRVHCRPVPKKVKKADAAEAHLRLVQRLQLDESNLLTYTDGSLLEVQSGRSTGAGFVSYRSGQEKSHERIPLGTRAEVYTSTMFPLKTLPAPVVSTCRPAIISFWIASAMMTIATTWPNFALSCMAPMSCLVRARALLPYPNSSSHQVRSPKLVSHRRGTPLIHNMGGQEDHVLRCGST